MKINIVYLIQGVFFQEGNSLGLSEKPGVGTAATIKKVLNYFVFAGVIFEDPENPGNFVGTMSDKFGYSDLSDVRISEHAISYTKKYHNRGDSIFYTFKKHGDKFVGMYRGDATGKGKTNCLITKTDSELFEPFKPEVNVGG